MKRFHIAFVAGTFYYVLLEYDGKDYEKARYANNSWFYDYSKEEETYLNVGYTSLGNISAIDNMCQFFEGFKPYKTEKVINVKWISECISKEEMAQQISKAIARIQKNPKSPYRDCIEKYYTDMKKFVESVEVD